MNKDVRSDGQGATGPVQSVAPVVAEHHLARAAKGLGAVEGKAAVITVPTHIRRAVQRNTVQDVDVGVDHLADDHVRVHDHPIQLSGDPLVDDLGPIGPRRHRTAQDRARFQHQGPRHAVQRQNGPCIVQDPVQFDPATRTIQDAQIRRCHPASQTQSAPVDCLDNTFIQPVDAVDGDHPADFIGTYRTLIHKAGGALAPTAHAMNQDVSAYRQGSNRPVQRVAPVVAEHHFA